MNEEQGARRRVCRVNQSYVCVETMKGNMLIHTDG